MLRKREDELNNVKAQLDVLKKKEKSQEGEMTCLS